MQNNIIFLQSTTLGYNEEVGLIDLLITHLEKQQNLFEPIQVIVPNQAMAVWVKDQIALKNGICANVDCVVLAGTVIDNIYLANNTARQLCDFNQVKFIIYKLLLESDLTSYPELMDFLLHKTTNTIDKLKAFELANQLQGIFHEYLYLRTEEMLNLAKSKFNVWQKWIWQQVQYKLTEYDTFLDAYSYFANLTDSSTIKLPKSLFIFGLTSIYPSQLKIISKIASKTTVYWYYQACSNEYYGDLLSEKARSKIEQKLLRKPDLSIDDLYLTAGNPLLANLGQQSREFVELLRANEVNVYEFDIEGKTVVSPDTSLLKLLQHDIRALKQRIRPELRLSNNDNYYLEPIELNLPQQSSVKINVCHNRMREVQVMFNQLANVLNNDATLKFSDVLISAPDIDEYVPYIQAVFDNEYALDSQNNKCYLPYYITGNRRHRTSKIIDTMLLILATPYQLTVSYLLEILQDVNIQNSLKISQDDIDTLKKWLNDNHTHFGYNEQDYAEFGYDNFSTYSFKQLLINVVLGASLDERVFLANEQLPYLEFANDIVVPYDNLDNAQINLANKLIVLINLLEEQREIFYCDEHNYNELDLANVAEYLDKLKEFITSGDEFGLICDDLIGSIRTNETMVVDLAVVISLIKEHVGLIKNRLSLSGKINCMSLQYARNLPSRYSYVLGLNFGEYPTNYQPNQLSLLAKEWYLADRNYTIEDKQAFLDIILATKEQLTLSFIGRKETDNSEMKPSPVVTMLLDVIGQSVKNFWKKDKEDEENKKEDLINLSYDYQGIVEHHALHPFYNNQQKNYAAIWNQVSQLSANETQITNWNFAHLSPIKLSKEQLDSRLDVNLKTLINTFSYINTNLYKTLGIDTFDNDIDLEDAESFELFDSLVAKSLFNYFESYANKFTPDELNKYLHAKGVLLYKEIGDIQFNHYYTVYQSYIAKRGNNKIKLEFSEKITDKYTVKFADEFYLQDNSIIICEDFTRLRDGDLAKDINSLSYSFRLKGLISYCVLGANTGFIKQHDIQNILLRQINAVGESKDFVLIVDDPDVVRQKIFKYYIRSLTNPVLIHQGSITAFANELTKSYLPADALIKARGAYNGFNDKQFEKIQADAILANIAEDYFDYIKNINGVNDIVHVGEILAQLREKK